jgi:phage terminase large subunit GpA-like protein
VNLADVPLQSVELHDGAAELLRAAAQAWAPPERLTVSQWADRHRVLTGKAAAEPGPWRTSRTPYLREIMDVLSASSSVTDVVFMAASQVGKSEVGNNWVGYVIDYAPGPLLMVEPTVEMAEKYSKQRIAPMIEMSDRLSAKISPSRKRDSGNTTTLKDFPGGMLAMVGANSASGLASMPIRYLVLDEVDRYPDDVDDEGSPIKLAEQRTITFKRRAKRYKASTPGRADTSLIAGEYESGSRAQYWVPCPHCGGLQVLHRRHLQWQKEIDPATGKKQHRVDTTVYVCQVSGCVIQEHHKAWMLEEVPGDLSRAHWRHRDPGNAKRSYHISGVYAPIGLGRSWAEIAAEWIEASLDPAKLQTFINLIDGEAYEDHSERLKGEHLKLRAEAFGAREVPPGYLLLTLGVDTQDDRIEAKLVAWSEHERSVVLDYVVFDGDPIIPEGQPGSPWDGLTAYRRKPVRNAYGIDLQIAMTAIDSGGHRTAAVYQYVRMHRHDRVIATKGSSLAAQPVLGRPNKKEAKNSKGDLAKYGVSPWMVGTDTAKDAIYARLEADGEIADPAARAVRFCDGLGDLYYEGLASEVRDSRSGRYVKVFARNEPLDCFVGALAAAHHPAVRVHRLSAADWDYLRRMHEPAVGDLFAGGTAHAQHPASEKAPAAAAPSSQAGVPTGTPASSIAAETVQAPAVASAGWVPDRSGWLD